MTLNISFGFEHMQYEEQTVKDHQSTSEHSIPVRKQFFKAHDQSSRPVKLTLTQQE